MMDICVDCRKKLVPAGETTFYVTDDDGSASEFHGHYLQCPSCGHKVLCTACNHTGYANHIEIAPIKGVIFDGSKL